MECWDVFALSTVDMLGILSSIINHSLWVDLEAKPTKQKKKKFPKENFPLSSIDWLVDASVGHQYTSFMDTFFKYNQIFLLKKTRRKQHSLLKMGYFATRSCSLVFRIRGPHINCWLINCSTTRLGDAWRSMLIVQQSNNMSTAYERCS